MDGGTIDRHPGERARRGSPPGWYADPVREASLRRWNGEHWTADTDPPAVRRGAPTPPKRREFNWPVSVATLVAVGYGPYVWWVTFPTEYAVGERVHPALVIGPLIIVFLLGLLGTQRRYSTASRTWAVAPLLFGALWIGWLLDLF